MTDAAGKILEKVRCSAYGVPTLLDEAAATSKGDVNRDGVTNFADLSAVLGAYGAGLSSPSSAYTPEMDASANGSIDFADQNAVLNGYGQSYTYRTAGKQSLQTVGNTVGYCGYLFDPATGLSLARFRWYDAGLGRWMSRDPIGYGGGSMSLGQYVSSRVTTYIDALGLIDLRYKHDDPHSWPDNPLGVDEIASFPELIQKIKQDLQNSGKSCVDNLDIITHGDAGSLYFPALRKGESKFRLKPSQCDPATRSPRGKVAEDLAELEKLLKELGSLVCPGGRVRFQQCDAGCGSDGDEMGKWVSNLLNRPTMLSPGSVHWNPQLFGPDWKYSAPNGTPGKPKGPGIGPPTTPKWFENGQPIRF